MDSYNLFGDDGSGMLEGLTDLGGGDTFAGSSTSGVTGDAKDSSENKYLIFISTVFCQSNQTNRKLMLICLTVIGSHIIPIVWLKKVQFKNWHHLGVEVEVV